MSLDLVVSIDCDTGITESFGNLKIDVFNYVNTNNGVTSQMNVGCGNARFQATADSRHVGSTEYTPVTYLTVSGNRLQFPKLELEVKGWHSVACVTYVLQICYMIRTLATYGKREATNKQLEAILEFVYHNVFKTVGFSTELEDFYSLIHFTGVGFYFDTDELSDLRSLFISFEERSILKGFFDKGCKEC